FSGTGSLGGAMPLTKSGSGGLTINNANTFNGGVTLNAGTLTLANGGAAGTGTLRLNGGTVSLSGSGQTFYGNALNIASNATMNSAGGNNNVLSGNWSGPASVTLTINIG